jgi:uncharacterized protein YceH (UPF0502 family)
MDIVLDHEEIRVIGCLLEKETTTPDQYPLSLNALTLACNQKSNREPVMQLEETQVQEILDRLMQKHLIREEHGFGSRVAKYKHRFCNTEFSELQLKAPERAILCTLFLRGPQTPGELRTRTQRLYDFGDVKAVDDTLSILASTEPPRVKCLPREPGKRESRYCHLFGDQPVIAPSTNSVEAPSGALERIAQLEETVATLQQELSQLKTQIDHLTGND